MSDVVDPAPPAPGMSPAVRTWGTVVLSAIILIGFSIMLYVVLTRPTQDNGLANVLLGTLSMMAGQVANYWLGSSAGSAAKDAKK